MSVKKLYCIHFLLQAGSLKVKQLIDLFFYNEMSIWDKNLIKFKIWRSKGMFSF
jgi:hypothetical protein